MLGLFVESLPLGGTLFYLLEEVRCSELGIVLDETPP